MKPCVAFIEVEANVFFRRVSKIFHFIGATARAAGGKLDGIATYLAEDCRNARGSREGELFVFAVYFLSNRVHNYLEVKYLES